MARGQRNTHSWVSLLSPSTFTGTQVTCGRPPHPEPLEPLVFEVEPDRMHIAPWRWARVPHCTHERGQTLLSVDDKQGSVGSVRVDADLAEAQMLCRSGLSPQDDLTDGESTPDAVEQFDDIAGGPTVGTLEARQPELASHRHRHEILH